MYLRLFAALALCSMPLLGGCASTGSNDGTGHSPPEFKMHNGKRIMKECGWFYASIQDTLFGVNYYADMEKEFGGGPYD